MHTEVLNGKQREILPLMSRALKDLDMYIAGGTALALQIGHRPSIDFDWFSEQIGNPEILLQRFAAQSIPHNVLAIGHETLYIETNSVQMSFIGYTYPLLREFTLWPEHDLRLASLEDIACMKLSAITNRGARKDFIDLFFIFKEYFSLRKCLELFSEKFQQRDFGHVLRSLVYFEDADQEPDVVTNIPVQWSALKKDFEQMVRKVSAL